MNHHKMNLMYITIKSISTLHPQLVYASTSVNDENSLGKRIRMEESS